MHQRAKLAATASIGMCCAKTAKLIEMPFGADSCGPKEPCMGSRFPGKKTIFEEGFRPFEMHWESASVYAAKGII